MMSAPYARRLSVAAIITLWCVAAPAAQQREEPDTKELTGPAAELTPAERDAWRQRANSRFMSGDVKGALDALNEIGEPRISSVKIEGLVRARRDLVNDYLGVEPGQLLTAEKLGRIKRRLDDLPFASTANVRYDPMSGAATVTPIVVERDRSPSAPVDWVPVGVRAAFQQDIRVDVYNAMGWGESISPSYRWDTNRPRAWVRMAAPAPGVLPGVIRIETLWERQSYESTSMGGVFREQRIRGAVGLSDWVTSWLRLEGATALDRIRESTYVGFDGNINTRAFDDRLALILTGGQWYALSEGESFVSGEAVLTARTTSKPGVPVLTTVAGVSVAGDTAPFAIWPGASSGQARGALLRAHPLHRSGIVRASESFGRQLIFTSTEYEHPLPVGYGLVSLAGFVDTAQAALRLDTAATSRLHVDVGGGVRFLTSRSGNKVRLDVGYGVRDGRVRVSAGYIVPWGTR